MTTGETKVDEVAQARKDNFEERAAILEYDANMPREQAEKRAREMMGERGS